MSIDMYNQVSGFGNAVDLSNRTLKSIELWMLDMLNPEIEMPKRYEAGLNAITLLRVLSEHMREEIPAEEQEILIKIFGQIINGVNKYIRKEANSLEKEFAGLRLIKKFLMPQNP